jgi:hypothetical protein
MYITIIFNSIKSFSKVLLLFLLVFLFSSCSFYNVFEDKQQESPDKITEDKERIKCPKTKIPYNTANYKYSKNNIKYLIKIKKIEIVCKSISNSLADTSTLFVKYKANLELKSNIKTSNKDLKLPKIYIAIVDSEREDVLAKIMSNLQISSIDNQSIINENKFQFNYNKINNLSIYFGVQ